MLHSERRNLYDWLARQPPSVKIDMQRTAFVNTTELDDKLRQIDSPPDARERARELFQERQTLFTAMPETEQEDADMDEDEDDDEDDDEVMDKDMYEDTDDADSEDELEEIDQSLGMRYDPNAGLDRWRKHPGNTYAKLLPKPS